MELTTNLIFPILAMLAGLFLEYWVIQPLRNNSASNLNNPNNNQNKTIKELIQHLLLSRPLHILVSGSVFLVFTLVYFFCVYPFYQRYYPTFFYREYQFSFNNRGFDNDYQPENYIIKIPKYIRSGQEAKFDIQIENESFNFSKEIRIQAGVRYIRHNNNVPFIESEPLEVTFENIAPNTTVYKTITYIPPKNLLNGDIILLTFYRNNERLMGGYSSNHDALIKIHTLNALFSWLFENLLFTNWANLLLFLIIVITSKLAAIEYRPPNESIRTISGFLYFCRVLIRSSALILLLIGVSAWLLTHYSQWYLSASLIALLTYVPFHGLAYKLSKTFIRTKSRKKRK